MRSFPVAWIKLRFKSRYEADSATTWYFFAGGTYGIYFAGIFVDGERIGLVPIWKIGGTPKKASFDTWDQIAGVAAIIVLMLNWLIMVDQGIFGVSVG